MVISIGLLAVGLLALYLGGEALIGGASRLALKLGVTPLVVGLTVVAFGTSAPELFVSLGASLDGLGDVSLGNVVGSNIANIGLILGISCLIRPIHIDAKLIKLDLPILLVASLALVLVLWNGAVSRLDGGVLVVCLLLYLAFTVWEAGREPDKVQDELVSAAPPSPGSLPRDLLLIAGGLIILVLGANWFVDGAVALAQIAGLSQAFIGLTVVAVGTSLPELAVSALAARKGQGDIAVGNVVGSNLFNILAILGITALVAPLTRGGMLWGDLATMVLMTAILLPLLLLRPHLSRGHGVMLLVMYALYVAWRASTG